VTTLPATAPTVFAAYSEASPDIVRSLGEKSRAMAGSVAPMSAVGGRSKTPATAARIAMPAEP
jgi:hypothetical protein